jgi:hypothetical protein
MLIQRGKQQSLRLKTILAEHSLVAMTYRLKIALWIGAYVRF